MNWWCKEEIVWTNITINSDCILKLIINSSSSLSRIWSAGVSLCDRLVGCLLLLALSTLSWLLLHILLLMGGMYVGRRRIWRLRGWEGGSSLIFPNLHQKLDLLEQFIIIAGIKTTSKLEKSLSFFFSQLSQKLVHKSFVVNFLHFHIGRLILQFRSFVWFINETLQELLSFLVKWIISSI